MSILYWQTLQTVPPHSYRCGYCGNQVASEKGLFAQVAGGGSTPVAFVHICPSCTRPSFIDLDGTVTPGVAFGSSVNDIPDQSLISLYEEARRSMSVNSYTAAVLACRKILMHIAVIKNAPENLPFSDYVTYLADNHYVPSDAKDWVDHIRIKGNEANHEIQIMGKDDAEVLISFIEMLLKIIFEFPATIKKKFP